MHTNAKRLTPLLCQRFHLSSLLTISHLFTPVAAQSVRNRSERRREPVEEPDAYWPRCDSDHDIIVETAIDDNAAASQADGAMRLVVLQRIAEKPRIVAAHNHSNRLTGALDGPSDVCASHAKGTGHRRRSG